MRSTYTHGAAFGANSVLPDKQSPFPVVAQVLSSGVFRYAIVGLIALERSGRRWQLTPPGGTTPDYAFGFVAIMLVFVAGIGPIVEIRFFEVPVPNAGGPGRYLAWCLVQDFVFFSLILRGLVDLVNPIPAIFITAVFFGMSHLPNYEMVVGTMMIGMAWGYLFLASRWIAFVVVSHWVMGLLFLSR